MDLEVYLILRLIYIIKEYGIKDYSNMELKLIYKISYYLKVILHYQNWTNMKSMGMVISLINKVTSKF